MKALEWSQYFSHYKSMGIFPDAQGQLTHKSLIGSCRISNPSKMFWLSSLLVRIKKNRSKIKELKWSQGFPHYNPIGVLIRSDPKPKAVNSPPQWCSRWNLITIGRLISEICIIESVDARRDAQTPARVPSYKLIPSLRLWWAKNIKWSVWSGNTTSTNCRQTHDTARKIHTSITRKTN